jgi:hypothetical protein
VGCDAVWLCVWLMMFVSTKIPLFPIIKQLKKLAATSERSCYMVVVQLVSG